ncbi:MAG: aldehyde dehydrogenase family protein [Actinomycetales bacterium]|nr:aldehyde dehydrogenase family protein [Actinomycetales bacterium]
MSAPSEPRVLRSILGGQQVDGVGTRPNVNPSDLDDVVCVASVADARVAEDAVEAAAEAFPAWSHTTPWQRAEILDRAGSEVLARADELGDLLAREEGKTYPEARGEVVRAGQILKYFSGVALQPHGLALDSVRPGIEVTVTREPVGVVSVITPWNFPIAIPAWKIAPALAFGNTVVFKPADLVPASAWELVDILGRAGLPDGVLNLVLGRGSEVGPVLTGSRRVDAITFTGSVSTGRGILASTAGTGVKVQLELGGKNPLVVTGHADLDVAVECAVQGGFGSTGQRCTASSILVVTDDIHDAFVDAMTARMDAWTVGDARTSGTDMGPVVDESQLAQDRHYLDLARSEGAYVIGGVEVPSATSGHFLAPALAVGTAIDHTINQEEVFGPVMSVVRAADYHEALALANTSTMNLSAGIVTTDLAEAAHFRRNSKAGMVMVNLPTAGVDFHVPFGGRGESSHGPREQGPAAVEFFTVSKTSYTAPGIP